MPSSSFNLKDLITAIDYLKRASDRLKANEDELARRMGIDPDKDLLVIPSTLVADKLHLPRWIRAAGNKEPFLIRYVRDRQFKQKKENENGD